MSKVVDGVGLITDHILLSDMIGLVRLPRALIRGDDNGLHDKMGHFQHETSRPEKGGFGVKLTEEELEKVLSTCVEGRLSPGPDGIISEFLKDDTCTERKKILLWINGVITSEEPGLRLSIKETHGLVVLVHKDTGSTDRVSDYRPVVLLNSLFQIVSYIIQERFVRIVEGSNILETGQGGFRARWRCDMNVHDLDYITRETQKATSNPFVRIDVDFENVFNSVPDGKTKKRSPKDQSKIVHRLLPFSHQFSERLTLNCIHFCSLTIRQNPSKTYQSVAWNVSYKDIPSLMFPHQLHQSYHSNRLPLLPSRFHSWSW